MREELSYLKGEAGEGEVLSDDEVERLHSQVRRR